MGNHQFQIPDNMAREWIQDTRDGKLIFINQITREQFELVQISQKELKQNYQRLIQRSTYIIPKTPKIILLKKLKGQTCILVQRYEEPLSKFITKITILADLLHLLKEIIQVMKCLYKKYGAFRLTDKMLGVNRNKQILIWINQARYKIQVQYPLQSGNQIEQEMISIAIRMVRQHSTFPLKYYLLQNPPLHFQNFLSGLNELTHSLKIIRMPRQRQTFRKAISPQSPRQTKVKQMKMLVLETKKRQTIFTKNICKTGRVPSFIKTINKNKIHILSSLRHKTAVSIDESKLFKEQKEVSPPPNNQFKSVDKMTSTKGGDTPKIDYEVGSYQVVRPYMPNSKGETGEHLTASETSNSYLVKPNPGLDVETFKINVNQMQQTNQQTKQQTHRQFQPSNTGMSSYFKQDQSSLLFISLSKMPQTLKQINPLVSLCGNLCESKYMDRNSKIEELIDEQSRRRSNAKMIEQQLGEIFSNRSIKSPRNYFQSLDNSDLLEEFGKVINFL